MKMKLFTPLLISLFIVVGKMVAAEVPLQISFVTYDPACPEGYGYSPGLGMKSCYDEGKGVDLYYNVDVQEIAGFPDMLTAYRNSFDEATEMHIVKVGPMSEGWNIQAAFSEVIILVTQFFGYKYIWDKFIGGSITCCLKAMGVDVGAYTDVESPPGEGLPVAMPVAMPVTVPGMNGGGLRKYGPWFLAFVSTALSQTLFFYSEYEGTFTAPYETESSQILEMESLANATAATVYYTFDDPQYGHRLIVGIGKTDGGYVASMTLVE